MTTLEKRIKRELPGTFDRRSWIVELEGWGINFRAKRSRRSYPIAWQTIWDKAMKIAVEHARRERAAKKKAGAR